MIRSSVSAFVVVCLCFAILQIPGKPETVAIPASVAATPVYDLLPLPGDCPGGVCPLPSRSVSIVESVSSVPVSMVRNSATWTYPGDIQSHLASGHGVSSAGMTTAQAVALHDSLHNGYTSSPTSGVSYVQQSSVQYVRRTPIRTTVRAVASIRPVQRVVNAARGVGRVVLFRRCR